MMNLPQPERGQPEYDDPTVPSPDAEAGDTEELLERVVEETLDPYDGKAFFPVIVRFAQRHRYSDITEPQLAAELIHEVLDYRFEGRALPINCHHWVADQLLRDDQARERLQALWQRALKASG